MARRLGVPPPSRPDVSDWVTGELDGLFRGPVHSSGIAGGQTAADAALGAFRVDDYARRRNEVWPAGRQGASRLSAYIRHGLLSLPRVWDAVEDGPEADVARFRDELLWQEYARHLYARLGSATRRSLRYSVLEHADATDNPWDVEAACVRSAWQGLTDRGWITNQERMWLASHWSVRHRRGWRDGEDLFFRFLLDGSRAANRLGWQWTVGALTGRPYGFSRWQVEKRAPGLCATCPLTTACPVEEWPAAPEPEPRPMVDERIRRVHDVGEVAGPLRAIRERPPQVVWITAESLGVDDPALRANPDLPAVFVFDERLLTRLRLNAARLVFMAETLADLAQRREVEVWRGDPVEVLRGRAASVTFTPVPGWRQRSAVIRPVEVHPWPWLVQPHGGAVTSFTAWARSGGAATRPR